MKSVKARKQRKAYFNAPLHQKQKAISAHLEENLLLKYDRRSVPVITGDTVKVVRGAFKGHEDKIAHIHVKDFRVEVEGVTITKADGKKIAHPIHPSNLLITKLNLTDKWRRRNLESKVSAETKKEIEAEAKQQIVEAEKEQKRLEQERLAAEAEAEAEEEPSQEPEIDSSEPKQQPEEPEKKPAPSKKEVKTDKPDEKQKKQAKDVSSEKPSTKTPQDKKAASKPASKKADGTKKEASAEKKKTSSPSPSKDENKEEIA